LFALFLLYFVFIAEVRFSGKLFGVDTSILLAVAIAGGSGSVVSILVRIREFAAVGDIDPWISFFTGFFRPVIGTGFALFVFAAIKSGIVPIAFDLETEAFFFVAASFVAGFSERFVPKLMSATARQVDPDTIRENI
jgi:hypothetical protein